MDAPGPAHLLPADPPGAGDPEEGANNVSDGTVHIIADLEGRYAAG